MRIVYVLALISLALPTVMAAQAYKGPPIHKPTETGKVPIENVAPDILQRVARFKSVDMPFHAAELSVREKQLVEKLVDANRAIEDIYWRQSDPTALEMYKELAGSGGSTRDKLVREYLFINASRYDLFNDNRPFVGNEPFYPGRNYYPHGLTRQEIESYVAQRPADKDAIYSSTTVLRRENGGLKAVPYHVEYKTFLDRAAKDLRDAAALSDDKSFAEFLRARADALLSDDYYPSDLLWVSLENPKFDIIFAPYETYDDDLMGVKGSYGGAVLIRNEAESAKLAVYQKHIAELQQALPIPAADKPSAEGHVSPMEVMDAPFRAGDLNHGYQAVADNLPNDPRIHQEKGSKKIFFKNFMDARVKYIVLPIAKEMMRPSQAQLATADGYMGDTLLHEISHGLGPSFVHVNGKQADIREAIGPLYSPLEEAKADVVGLFCAHYLVEHGVLTKEQLPQFYSSHVADFFRTVRLSAAEAHGLAGIMEFNYLAAQKAIVRDPDGKYGIDFARMPDAITALSKQLLEFEANGDRAGVEKWFKKYGSVPQELKASLDKTTNVPIDVLPKFSFPENPE
ncbi:MAG: dipeptidyl-peptidase 3 family protein [Terriglobales bacterium]